MSHESASSHHVGESPAEERLRRALRSLPARIPPPGLTIGLRVLASRERQRFLERRSLRGMFACWRERASLNAGDMMRSLVLPLAGGVCTAVVLFSTWLVPTYPLHANNGVDVPTMLSTEATVTETGAMGLSGGNAVVDVTVDNQGRVVGIDIVSGGEMLQDPGRRSRLIENLLMYTQFAPATSFGRPMTSKVRLAGVFSSRVDVKD